MLAHISKNMSKYRGFLPNQKFERAELTLAPQLGRQEGTLLNNNVFKLMNKPLLKSPFYPPRRTSDFVVYRATQR